MCLGSEETQSQCRKIYLLIFFHKLWQVRLQRKKVPELSVVLSKMQLNLEFYLADLLYSQ